MTISKSERELYKRKKIKELLSLDSDSDNEWFNFDDSLTEDDNTNNNENDNKNENTELNNELNKHSNFNNETESINKIMTINSEFKKGNNEINNINNEDDNNILLDDISISSRLDAFQEKINAMLAEGNKMLNQTVNRKHSSILHDSKHKSNSGNSRNTNSLLNDKKKKKVKSSPLKQSTISTIIPSASTKGTLKSIAEENGNYENNITTTTNNNNSNSSFGRITFSTNSIKTSTHYSSPSLVVQKNTNKSSSKNVPVIEKPIHSIVESILSSCTPTNSSSTSLLTSSTSSPIFSSKKTNKTNTENAKKIIADFTNSFKEIKIKDKSKNDKEENIQSITSPLSSPSLLKLNMNTSQEDSSNSNSIVSSTPTSILMNNSESLSSLQIDTKTKTTILNSYNKENMDKDTILEKEISSQDHKTKINNDNMNNNDDSKNNTDQESINKVINNNNKSKEEEIDVEKEEGVEENNKKTKENENNSSNSHGNTIDFLLTKTLDDAELILENNELEFLRLELKELQNRNRNLQQENEKLKNDNNILIEKHKDKNQQLELVKQENIHFQQIISSETNDNHSELDQWKYVFTDNSNHKIINKRHSFIPTISNNMFKNDLDNDLKRHSFMSDISPLGEIKYNKNQYLTENSNNIYNIKTDLKERKISESHTNLLKEINKNDLSSSQFKDSMIKHYDNETLSDNTMTNKNNNSDHTEDHIIQSNNQNYLTPTVSQHPTSPSRLYKLNPEFKNTNDDTTKNLKISTQNVERLTNRLNNWKTQIQNIQKDLGEMLECEKRIGNILSTTTVSVNNNTLPSPHFPSPSIK